MKKDNGKVAAARRGENGETGAGAGANKRTHAKKKAISTEQLVDACRRSNGIMSVVCQMLGIGWHTAERYIKDCPEAAEAFQGARETVKDVAESSLFRIIKDQNHPRHFDAVIFALKTLAKDRGFTERVENDISGELKQPPPLNIVIERNPSGSGKK
jgi:hypothetical protein